jgi:hypothetical protein
VGTAAQLPPRGDMRPFDFIVIGEGPSLRQLPNIFSFGALVTANAF